MLEESFGMKPINFKKQSMKHMKKALLVKMLAAVDMILMYMCIQVQEHIFVEKSQH